MKHQFRPLAVSLYGVAAILVVLPITDTVLSLWPLHTGDLIWRFGAAGIIASHALLMPLIGLLLASVTAVLLEHRRTLRGLSVVAAFVGLTVAVGIGLFALDVVQTRARVEPGAQAGFDSASLRVFIRMGLVVPAAIAIAAGSWAASGRVGRESGRSRGSEAAGKRRGDGGQERRSDAGQPISAGPRPIMR